MALTPEDVVNKRFQATKFREGYDQDEVDDFLDEVVVELRRLNQENEELRAQLGAEGGAVAPKPAVVVEEVAEVSEEVVEVSGAPIDDGVNDETGSTSLLVLARRLHEEHVREGIEKRDALIAEGQATAARLISDAEAAQKAQIAKFETERADLQHKVEELRTFEANYRSKLKSYIEEQLTELSSTGVGA